MLFRIEVRPVPAGWAVQVQDTKSGQALLLQPRLMRLCKQGELEFPLPPQAEAAALPANAPERTLCLATNDNGTLAAAYANVLGQQAGIRGVADFGRYLFLALLGDALWSRLDAAAGVEPIELALSWPRDQAALNRLPWEMMRSANGFLATLAQIAITRRVAGTKCLLGKLTTPPRVLFVIGTEPGNDVIRPGAEYLGMLRTLGDAGMRLSLKTHLIYQATSKSLRAAIIAFRPTVVHFICHGVVEGGRGKLLLVDSQNLAMPSAIDGEALGAALAVDGAAPLPEAVVLNACSTGTNAALDVGRPLAMELIERGIPIVVGMAGDIADQACRLFTSSFYLTLLRGGDIAHAAADGRRAALIHGGYDPQATADWALPALFLSDAVVDLRISDTVPPVELEWHRIAAEYAPRTDPVFCDRLGMLTWFDVLMAKESDQRSVSSRLQDLQVLAIAVEIADRVVGAGPQLGRTWLLREFAAHAAREGHLACLVTKELIGDGDWPTDLEQLLRGPLDTAAMQTAVKSRYDLDWSWQEVPRLLEHVKGQPLPADAPPAISRIYRKDPKDPKVLAAALTVDLMRLLDAARAKYGRSSGDCRLVLMIDDLHQMGKEAVEGLLMHLLGDFGLRGVRNEVRIVFTYSTVPTAGQQPSIDAINHWLERNGSAQLVKLTPFRQGGEDILAYRQYLLHWNDDGSLQPLTMARPESDTIARGFLAKLAKEIQGMPSKLKSDRTQMLVQTYRDLEVSPPVLRKADDEDALQAARLLLRGGAGFG